MCGLQSSPTSEESIRGINGLFQLALVYKPGLAQSWSKSARLMKDLSLVKFLGQARPKQARILNQVGFSLKLRAIRLVCIWEVGPAWPTDTFTQVSHVNWLDKCRLTLAIQCNIATK